MTTSTCRTCKGEIALTVYGWGHITNPGHRHHVPRPTSGRDGNPTPPGRAVAVSAGRHAADE